MLRRWLPVTALAGVAAGCPGADEPPAPGAGALADPPGFEVQMMDVAFVPEDVAVGREVVDPEQPVGGGQILADRTAVRWVNRDEVEHTVTFPDEDLDSGPLVPGAVYQRTFIGLDPGEYAYVCTIHDDMTGTITVVE